VALFLISSGTSTSTQSMNAIAAAESNNTDGVGLAFEYCIREYWLQLLSTSSSELAS
jgi:hypothetical protein